MNDDLEKVWNEVFVGLMEVLSPHLPGVTEENHEKPRPGNPVFWLRYEPSPLPNTSLYLFCHTDPPIIMDMKSA
jgi:hypothetical protein